MSGTALPFTPLNRLFRIYGLRFMIWIERLRRDALIRVHPVHLRLCYPWLSVLYLPSVASVCSVVHRGFFCDLALLGDLCVLARGQVLVVTTFVQQLKR